MTMRTEEFAAKQEAEKKKQEAEKIEREEEEKEKKQKRNSKEADNEHIDAFKNLPGFEHESELKEHKFLGTE